MLNFLIAKITLFEYKAVLIGGYMTSLPRKRCTRCKLLIPLIEYYERGAGFGELDKRRLRSECKKCNLKDRAKRRRLSKV